MLFYAIFTTKHSLSGSLAAKNDENSSPSLVYYVVPVAIALSVLLLVVLVLLVYLKQRRKGDPAGVTSAQVQNGSMLVVGTARLNKESIGKPRVSGPLDKVSCKTVRLPIGFGRRRLTKGPSSIAHCGI